MLIGSQPGDTSDHMRISSVVGSKKMATSDLWFVCPAWVHVCLAWLCEVFLQTLTSLTNIYTGCGRPTLNLIECFRLGSVRSATEITEMNSEITVK